MNDEHENGEAKALAHLTRDLAKESPPELDWAAMEDKLLLRVAAEPVQAPRRTVSPVIWISALAAAAAILLIQGSMSRPSPVEHASTHVVPAVARTAARSHVQTGPEARSFSKAGLAEWTLEANSEADIADEGERITVHLARGAIRAEVVPQPVKERFVVIVEDRRVAVHGTRFRVAREASVQVDVERGVVAVGVVGGEPTFMLHAPRGGTFPLQGGGGELRNLVAFSLGAPQPPVQPSTEAKSAQPATGAKAPEMKPAKALDESTLRSRAAALLSQAKERV